MTIEEAKKEIKKLIDKYNNDVYKYDDLHVNSPSSYTRSSAYKNYVESKGKRAGLQEALHLIEKLDDYDILFSKYCELKKENELLNKNNIELINRIKLDVSDHYKEFMSDYNELEKECDELNKANDKLKKQLEVLEILKKYVYYDNNNHFIKMKQIRKSIYNFDYEDLKEWLENE